MATQEKAVKAVQLAVKHLGQGVMVSSARLALSDAVHLLSVSDWDYAWKRALESIAYSVGMLHPVYEEQRQEMFHGLSG